jgi:hypothetical protein
MLKGFAPIVGKNGRALISAEATLYDAHPRKLGPVHHWKIRAARVS